MAVGVVVAVQARWVHAGRAQIANPVACVLLALNIVPLITGSPGQRTVERRGTLGSVGPVGPARLRPPASLPDVYYLIFDRYANERVLREQFGFDNGAVPRRARAREGSP